MYQILLEGKRLKRNQITGMHLMVGFLLIGIGIVTWSVPNTVKQTALDFLNYFGMIYALLGFLIIIICILFNRKVIQTKANTIIRIIEMMALLLMLIFSVYKKWYLPVGYSSAALLGIILTYILEANNKKDKKATFNETGVKIPGLGSNSNRPWSAIKNIILKNNILTVDFRNNKLYQAHLSKNNKSLNQEDFVAFAKEKITQNIDNYKEDW
jgi:hypothetical protein